MRNSYRKTPIAIAFLVGLMVFGAMAESTLAQRGGRGNRGGKASRTSGRKAGSAGQASRRMQPSNTAKNRVKIAARGKAKNAMQNRGKQAIGNKAQSRGIRKSDIKGNPRAKNKLQNSVKNRTANRAKDQVRNRIQNRSQGPQRGSQRLTQQGPINPNQLGGSPALEHLDEIRNHVRQNNVKDQIKDRVKDHVKDRIQTNVKDRVKDRVRNNVKDRVHNRVNHNVKDRLKDNVRNYVRKHNHWHWHGPNGYNKNTYVQICNRANYVRKNRKLCWGFATWKTYYPTACHWWYNYCGPRFYFDPTCSLTYDWTYYTVPATVVDQVTNPEIQWYLGMKCALVPGRGLGIEDVTPNSPAELAGLTPGMFILAANGIQIESEASMPIAIDQSGGLLGLDVLVSDAAEVVRVDVTLQPVAVSHF